MAVRKLVLAAVLAAVAVPAAASVVVIGNSGARRCFEAADSPLSPQVADIRGCDTSIREEALSRDDLVATYVNRGILKLRRNMVTESIVDFDAAIAMNPAQGEAYLNKGAALIRLENPSEALRLFTVALERNTTRPEIAHYGRAVANEALGNTRAAYNDYRRAAELSPEWEEPRAELTRFRVVPRP